ncbi:STM2901 family protein [Xenorhabdus anantnagensis]|uniref:Phage membrane protein n=1 Tax=Xenorhabdus anantnagensis TaxID=3025875 RepID=A0ABT5LVA8_9GAMM|nr:hypothetical protein [Xenorhabdus anantnagensis]
MRPSYSDEPFFGVFIDAVNEQLGWVGDIIAIVCIILGQPILKTRGKFAGATKGTSLASVYSRRYLNRELPFQLPTFTNASLKTLKPKLVNNLGAVVGRTVPVVGWVILAYDVTTIVYKATTRYNKIARKRDKIW